MDNFVQIERVIGTWHLTGIPDPAIGNREWTWDPSRGRPVALVPPEMAHRLAVTSPELYAASEPLAVKQQEPTPRGGRPRKGAA